MKRTMSFVLCILMIIMILPTTASADSKYSTVSNSDVDLECPDTDSFYNTPLRATVKSTKPNGSIYFMPTPKDGNGVLGTVANGTEVTILAEKSGYYFFTTADGRMGWNGRKFFTVLGSVSNADTPKNSKVFTFDSGASILLPSGFYTTGVERDRNNAYVSSYFTDFNQNMDITLTEIDTYMYYQRDTDFMNSLYSSLKEDYPRPTYDTKKADMFALSGYDGDYIYYFHGILSDQVIYMMKMFYPTKNRNTCDQ